MKVTMRQVAASIVLFMFLSQGFARQEQSVCGTYRDIAQVELHFHRQKMKKRVASVSAAAGAPAASRDVGDIAVIEDSGDIIARRNDFNLDRKTIQFSTVGSGSARYRFQTSDSSY